MEKSSFFHYLICILSSLSIGVRRVGIRYTMMNFDSPQLKRSSCITSRQFYSKIHGFVLYKIRGLFSAPITSRRCQHDMMMMMMIKTTTTIFFTARSSSLHPFVRLPIILTSQSVCSSSLGDSAAIGKAH